METCGSSGWTIEEIQRDLERVGCPVPLSQGSQCVLGLSIDYPFGRTMVIMEWVQGKRCTIAFSDDCPQRMVNAFSAILEKVPFATSLCRIPGDGFWTTYHWDEDPATALKELWAEAAGGWIKEESGCTVCSIRALR